MAIGDTFRDPVTREEYVVFWDGSRGSGSLLDYDTRWTRQRSDAKDRSTSGATMTIDLRANGTIYKGAKGQIDRE